MVKFAVFCCKCSALLEAGTTPVPLRKGWRKAWAPGLEETWHTCPEHPQEPGEGFLVWDHAGVLLEPVSVTWSGGGAVYTVSISREDAGLWKRRPEGGHELIGHQRNPDQDVARWIEEMTGPVG
ncbi:MAG: hypothetical protein V3S01_08120 [Dehalococcoidia bacterium]